MMIKPKTQLPCKMDHTQNSSGSKYNRFFLYGTFSKIRRRSNTNIGPNIVSLGMMRKFNESNIPKDRSREKVVIDLFISFGLKANVVQMIRDTRRDSDT